MEIIYAPGMITINATMVVVLVSFLILVAVLNRLMFRPLLDTMDARKERMDGLEKESETNKSEAQKLVAKLREQEQAAKKEAIERKKELEAIGSRKASEIIDAARKEIIAIKEDVDRQIEAQLGEARKSFQREAETIAERMIEQILGRGVRVS